MGNTIGGKIVLEGESEYRQALKNISSDQKELRSEMKLCSSEFDGQQNSIAALTAKHEILEKQIASQSEKIKVYAKAVEESEKIQEAAGEKVELLASKLEEAQKEMENMSKSSDTSKETLEEQKNAVDTLQKELDAANKAYDNAARSTNDWKTSLNNAQTDLNTMESALKDLDGYIDEAGRSSDGCATSINEMGKEMQTTSEQTITLGDVLKANLLSDAIESGIRAIADGIRDISQAAVETGSSFEASMSQVAATMGMTAEEVNNGSKEYTLLSDAAKKCGKETMFSASQAGDALNYLALAGYDAEKSAATLPKVLDLAAAGGLDLAYASDLVTDSMAALNMETGELDKYIDEMARTSQKSNTSVAQLGEATLVCAGTASLTKQKLETLNTELGILANNGIKGAEGGTHLRNIMLSLAAPTDKASETLGELGVRVSDSEGNMRDLNDIMIDLNKSMENMSSVEKTQAINRIFNKTDIAAVNSLLKGTGEEFDKLNEEIKKSDGAAAAMAETLNNNLKGKVTILGSALEGLGISAYEIFDDSMKDAVDAATESVGRLQKSIDSGDLGVSLDKMSKALNEFLESAIDVGEDALPVLIDGLTWLLDNSDAIIAGVGGIVTANLTMNVVVPTIEAVVTAWQAYKIVNEEATISQWALNTAMNANPAGLLIGAIVGLTSALGIYALTAHDSVSETDELNQKIHDNMAEREKSNDGLQKNAAYARTLADQLATLSAKETLTATEQYKVRDAVGQLNEMYPELNLTIDENTGKLEQNADALKANLEQALEQEKLTVIQEMYSDALRDSGEAEANLLIIEDEIAQKQLELAEVREELKNKSEEYNQSLQDGVAYGAEYDSTLGSLRQREMELSEEVRNLEEDQEEYHRTIEETKDEVDQYDRIMQEQQKQLEEVAEATEETARVSVEYKDKVYEVSSEVAENINNLGQAYLDAKEDAAESLRSQVGIFEELVIKSDLSAQQMKSNLDSQTQAFSQYSSDLETLRNSSNEKISGILASLAEMGLEGAGYVHELAGATDEEVDAIIESYTKMLDAKNMLTDTLADVNIGYSDQMEAMLGIQDETMQSYTEMYEAATAEASEIIMAAGENDVETVTQTMADMNTAVNEGTVTLNESVIQMCTTLQTTTTQNLNIVDGKSLVYMEIGKSIPIGMAQGVRDGTSEFVNAVEEMLDKAVNEAIKKAEKAAKKIDKALGSALK